ncbi:hypothetical protein [Olsenella sp. kh2p3]|uniref:hypothetical protein n=1 Tax=Olsenella sp. kh2p3 TaxID=1797112 RepID=UPI0009193E06|nr:hypothetical protein [Olsenella sp. kh2p3]MCI2085760.1 hypothetical protein [Olsenella sp.]SFX12417.1 hypothetical protein SAMN04487823_101579 [Olsenella sp. kh2p3]
MSDNKAEQDFTLGRPVLVCRWRLASGGLPMENRHLRALSKRVVNGQAVSTQLVAWAKQHIEWTLRDGSALNPDGVLMIVLDEKGQAAMTVGPYEPIDSPTAATLADRAIESAREAEETGVAPETLWVARGDTLVCGMGAAEDASGSVTLVCDLANTVGITVTREQGIAQGLLDNTLVYDEAFLVSDEHGIVCASDAAGPRGAKLAEGYERLLAAQKNKR